LASGEVHIKVTTQRRGRRAPTDDVRPAAGSRRRYSPDDGLFPLAPRFDRRRGVAAPAYLGDGDREPDLIGRIIRFPATNRKTTSDFGFVSH
jgi:hypothetical protein